MSKYESEYKIFEDICQSLVGVPSIKFVFIAVKGKNKDDVIIVCAKGEFAGAIEDIALSSNPDLPEGQGPIGRSIRSKMPVWVDDYLTNSMTMHWREMGRANHFRGSASLPIMHQDEVKGVISIYTKTRGYFDTDTRPLLQEFAVQLGFALEACAAHKAAERNANVAKAAATQLDLANQRLNAIIAASSDLICTLDRDGRFVTVANGSILANCANGAGLIGRSCFDYTLADSRSRDILNAALKCTELPRARSALTITFMSEQGGKVPIALSMIWSEDEKVFHCVGRDLRPFKALEDAVIHAQRLESLGVLTGGIAHDFNNLLSVIIGGCEFLLASDIKNANKSMVEIMMRTSERGAGLTKQLLAFARRQPLVPTKCSLREIILSSVPIFKQALGPSTILEVNVGNHDIISVLDETQLVQSLINLIINSNDAMPNGGVIKLDLRILSSEDVDLRDKFDLPGEFAVVLVEDSGCGISSENLLRIYEPFFTTKGPEKGTGLGLSMVYGFVSQSGGYMDVISNEGTGTIFSLLFPASRR